ncbi:CIS tube protein [Paracoccus aminovorans]|uniref:CIS tube protein n=1 Tax=Paracoccus aminovorans TaxID=34004 RepID=UPI002B2593EB|nr:hypothetical protein [Paracoccus aminovorans]
MSGYSRTPRLLKGAIVAFRPPVPIPEVIPFQINPESLQRTIEANAAEGEGGADGFRLAGAPKEMIKVEAVLDATDDLEQGRAEDLGLHPRLAQLETLLYPAASTVIANAVLLRLGTVEILPATGPFTVFIWGKTRILPVRLKSLSITEEAYDPKLNPIRAKVSMDLAVLSYSDLESSHPGYAMFLSHQLVKETMAQVGRINSLGSVLGSDVKIM